MSALLFYIFILFSPLFLPGQAGAVQKSAEPADPGVRRGWDGRWQGPGSAMLFGQVVKLLIVVGFPPHPACRVTERQHVLHL